LRRGRIVIDRVVLGGIVFGRFVLGGLVLGSSLVNDLIFDDDRIPGGGHVAGRFGIWNLAHV